MKYGQNYFPTYTSVPSSPQMPQAQPPQEAEKTTAKSRKKKKAAQANVDNQIYMNKIYMNLEKKTTLMIRNIPINNFTQEDMMAMIDQEFRGLYDYFYLPKDLKTQTGVGFAFINFIHPVFIIEFYKKFHGILWKDRIANCNSNKQCDITYANV
jgi:RNA recognition motif-containing protein